jgi:hypothetical protein
MSGKLLVLGGVVGLIAAFLPLASVSVQVQGPGGADLFGMLGGRGPGGQPALGSKKTAMVVEDWRGAVGLVGYLAALFLAFVLYPPQGLAQKGLSWAAVGVGLLLAVLAVWLLVLALDTGSANLMGMGSVKASAGVGAFINVLAAVAVAVGGFLKAREEKQI